jgi:hypothetical protein
VVGGLARAVDVEEPEGDGGEAVAVLVAEQVLLGRQLAHRIGAQGADPLALGLERRRVGAVHGTGRRADELPDARLPAGLEEQERAGGVRRMAAEGIRDRGRDAGEGGEVDDGVHAVDGLRESGGIGHRALDEVDVETGEVLPRAGGEVVEDDDPGDPWVLECPAGQVRADEAGATGDQQRRAVVWVHVRHCRGRRDRADRPARASGKAAGRAAGGAAGARAAVGKGEMRVPAA